jgi:hypothetical protein
MIKPLLFIILICVLNTLKAQDFAPLHAEWYYERMAFGWPGTVNFIKITSTGDTAIIEKQCNILTIEESGFKQYEFIYNDSNRVFWYNSSKNKFTKLYDFNANTGDSWHILLPQSDEDSMIVSIDSTSYININSLFRKVQYIHNNSNTWLFAGRVIEGIGLVGTYPYESAFLFPQSGLADPVTGSLRCYSDTILGFFKGPDEDACDTTYNLDWKIRANWSTNSA